MLPRRLARLARRLVLLAAIPLAACVDASPRVPPPGGGVPVGPIDYSPRIDSPALWNALAARPATEHVARTEVVKVTFDRTDGRVYFQESKRWPLHQPFAASFLSTLAQPVGDPWLFNQVEYGDGPGRRFTLGTITHYIDSDTWAVDFYAGDKLSLDDAARVFRAIKPLVFFGDGLRYRPVSPSHERDIARARALMPVVTTDEIFGKLRYQPLELGEAYGYLRVFPPGEKVDITSLRPWDIVVLGELPEDLPVVAGVISAELQAPLGHINVLCHNRRTPNMAARGATGDPNVLALRDKLAHLVVDAQSFRVEVATRAEAEKSWQAKRPKRVFSPARDDRDGGMPLLGEPGSTEVSLVGAKAAQLALVAGKLPGHAVPRAFGLPFHAYARFLEANRLGPRIDAMLSSPAFRDDPEVRRRELDALRGAMEAGVVPADVLDPLMARIKAELPPGAVRFRSSTNAEDLPGFSGAGLYRSARVADPQNADEVKAALRRVWASVWLWGAYEEREFYRIDHRAVGMAVLVQTSIDDIVASGVAITANPWNQGQPAFFMNAQAKGGSVTGARGDELPEQILYYTFDTGRGFERLSKSARTGGAELLAAREIEELAGYLRIIHTAFTGQEEGASDGRAVDVEFLVGAPDRRGGVGPPGSALPRRVLIVQARPYTVSWSSEQRWR